MTTARNAQQDLHQLADEQAALRRVATLVARQARPAEVFAAVAEEAALTLDVPLTAVVRFEADGTATQVGASGRENPFPVGTSWPLDDHSVSGLVARTGQPARVDDYADVPGEIAATLARNAGIHTAAGVPILVDGRPWGVMMALSTLERPLHDGVETQLAAFTELVATAIANTQARDDLGILVAEQAALRRVATLVGRGTSPGEVFAAVAEEVGQLLGVDVVNIVRHDGDDTATAVASWSATGGTLPLGSRLSLDGPSIIGTVARTGRPARIDNYDEIPAAVTYRVEGVTILAGVGAPIVVEGRVWGTVVVLSVVAGPLPTDTEARLAAFTELVGVAIADTQAREQLRGLAEEQAALRRVAVRVAQEASPAEVFAAVAEEVGLLLGVDVVNIVRHDRDETATAVASWSAIGGTIPLGKRLPLAGPSIMGSVARTGRPARIDSYDDVPGAVTYVVEGVAIRAGVGAPIAVEGRVWGTVVALSARDEPLPGDTEARLSAFTELMGVAIADTQAREELRALAEEQAALRRVAVLVAQEASPTEVFAAVAEEVAGVLDVPLVQMSRYVSDDTVAVIGAWGEQPFRPGTTWPLDGPTLSKRVLQTGEPARIDDYADVTGTIGDLVREAGIRSGVGVPIIVDGTLWGVMMVLSTETEPLPVTTEGRLARFTELVATAISNTEAREALRRSEGLYRRAITEAGAVPYVLDYGTGTYSFIGEGVEELTGYKPAELTHEAFGALVLETFLHGEQARLDATDAAYRTRTGEFERWRSDLRVRRRDGEIRWLSDASVEIQGEDGSSVGSIGMLQDVTERMRTDEERLRLAAILEATTDVVTLADPDGRVLYVNRAGRALLGLSPTDDLSSLSSSNVQPEEGIATAVRDGVWTAESVLVARDGREIPVSQVILAHKDAGGTVTFFSGIARDLTERLRLETSLRRTQDEQAALRRVATLVAEEAAPSAVFDAVAGEISRLFEVEMSSILRYEPDGSAVKVGGSGETNPYPVGTHFSQVGVLAEVWRTGASARIDDYRSISHPIIERMVEAGIRSSVAVPIVVNGATWGVVIVLTTAEDPPAAGTEDRLDRFTGLVGTAITNAETRAALQRLLEEQAALRAVATIVAEGAESRGVFDAVCAETGRLIGATGVNLVHFTSDDFSLTMAGWSLRDTHVPTGTRLPLDGETINTLIRRSGAPERVDSYEGVTGELAEVIRRRGIKSEVGAPVVVEGAIWGALIAGWDDERLSEEGTERRLASFAELVATAVSNASNRSELVASRARIVAAADEARRRIERNLHDGIQQQLVALELEIKAVEAGIPIELRETHQELDRLEDALERVLDDVREISQGVHPATLSQWGLGPALRTLTRRSTIPIELEIGVPDRLAESIEIATYYVVSEALANVVKHAQASYARVEVRLADGWLHATVGDDGIGGADPRAGSGLTGLVDRVEALGGRLSLTSAPSQGTTLAVALPLRPRRGMP